MDEIKFKELNERVDALRDEILALEYKIRRIATLETSRMEEQVAENRRLLDEYSKQSYEMIKADFNRA